MASVRSAPVKIATLKQAATVLRKEVSKADTNKDGKITRNEVKAYASTLRNKALGQALVTAHGVGSRQHDGAASISVDFMKHGAIDVMLGNVTDKDANKNKVIDPGKERSAANRLKSFKALADLAKSLKLGE